MYFLQTVPVAEKLTWLLNVLLQHSRSNLSHQFFNDRIMQPAKSQKYRHFSDNLTKK